MPFTAEQKKAHRQKKKLEEEKLKEEQKKRIMLTRVPENKHKKPLKKHKVGNPSDDYGGHQKALNYHAIPMDKSLKEVQLTFKGGVDDMPANMRKYKLKQGDCTVGFVYEGDWKAKSCTAGKGQRTMSQESEKCQSIW